jgi:hypothetical protein
VKRKQNKTKCRPRAEKDRILPNLSSVKKDRSKLSEVIYDVHLQPGEELSLPTDVAEMLGSNHLRVSIRAADDSGRGGLVRNHMAFLNSFAPEDEGLYDDYSAG